MIQRLLINKDALIEDLSAHTHGLTLLTESDWCKLVSLEKLLQPCERASKLLGGEHYVTLSVVLPVLAYLKREMCVSDDDPGYSRKFKEAFYVDLKTRVDKLEDSAILQIATALDVRFKSLKCIEKSKRASVWGLIERLLIDIEANPEDCISVTEPPPKKARLGTGAVFNFSIDESDSDDDAEHGQRSTASEKCCIELSLYKSRPVETNLELDPLMFWKHNENLYPTLAKLVKVYLTCPASSVPVERLFSSAGELISKKRNSLKPDNANMLLSLYC